MVKKIAIITLAIFCFSICLPARAAADSALAVRLSGRILLAVEQRGEAWYVNPKNLERYALTDPAKVIKEVGIGITNADLAKIPLAGSSAKITDRTQINFIARVKGKIFLQVQDRGQAWYVNPVDGKRYYLITREGIAAVIRKLGLGISNANLAQITIAPSSLTQAGNQSGLNPATTAVPYDLNYLERKINSLVNAERVKNGLPPLAGNADIAAVAREHSQNLAQENQALTALNKVCDYFMIHHQGFSFGLNESDRLANRGIYYFSNAGENIAIQGGKEIIFITTAGAADQNSIDNCLAAVSSANDALRTSLESNISAADKINLIQSEIAKRKLEFAAENPVRVTGISYAGNDEMASEIVLGWMASPGHRANILRPEFNEAGIGVAYVNGYIIATQDFITRISCGYQGAPCCPSYSCYVPNTCRQDSICR
ncbi:MAG: CAP domain-containing protein [Patescibacteria group bacterium]|nr:CAP domain-containing protein [Patescibacteria group bacterium]